MVQSNIPISLPGFQLTGVRKEKDWIEIAATSIQKDAFCPNCQRRSTRVHSYYTRAPADMPIFESRVRLLLRVRRFRCEAENCSKSTFAENFPEFIVKSARRTKRLGRAMRAIAFALGGQPGSRLAGKLKMPVSGDTLLRIIRDTPDDTQSTPKVIGVDDWAKRRLQVYGTIVVDLERHRVIDLLEDRTAETLAEWLQSNQSVKLVARDRSPEYARGISQGAPQAEQVADRWHLLVNLREALERSLDRLRPELNALYTAMAAPDPDDIPIRRQRKRSNVDELAIKERLKQSQDLYHEIHHLYEAGYSKRAIARQLGKHRATINKYLAMKEFPPEFTRKRVASILDPYEEHLRRRWKDGSRNASELWREIRAQGYPGTRKQVAQWVYERREQLDASTPFKYREALDSEKNNPDATRARSENMRLPVARRLVWICLKPEDKLTPDEIKLRNQLSNHKILAQALKLGEEFREMIQAREAHGLAHWLKSCEASKIPELRNLALGMQKDFSAIQNALQLPWSNGQTEGQINRLKLLKRQMYGRAKFDLLRLRCLRPP